MCRSSRAVHQAGCCVRSLVSRERRVVRSLVQSLCRAAAGCIKPEGVEGARPCSGGMVLLDPEDRG